MPEHKWIRQGGKESYRGERNRTEETKAVIAGRAGWKDTDAVGGSGRKMVETSFTKPGPIACYATVIRI